MKRLNVAILYKDGSTMTIHNIHDVNGFFRNDGDLYVNISYESNVDDLVFYKVCIKNIVSIIIFGDEETRW